MSAPSPRDEFRRRGRHLRAALGALGVTVLVAAGVGAYVSQRPSVAPSGSASVLPFAAMDTQGIAAVRAFFKQVGIHALKLFVDLTIHAADALRIPGTPTTLLIDRSGREIAQHVGPAEWDAAPTVGFLRKLIATTRRRTARLETR